MTRKAPLSLARHACWLVGAALVACGSRSAPFGAGIGYVANCPASAPVAGSGCTGALECEYGAAPDVACNSVFQCAGGTWSKISGEAPYCMVPLAVSPACPATFAALQAQTTCDPDVLFCLYPEAYCTCGTQCGMSGRSTPSWCCPDGPSGSPGCPTPRPRIGTSCIAQAEICDYGGCTGNVTLECVEGTWQPVEIGCPG